MEKRTVHRREAATPTLRAAGRLVRVGTCAREGLRVIGCPLDRYPVPVSAVGRICRPGRQMRLNFSRVAGHCDPVRMPVTYFS